MSVKYRRRIVLSAALATVAAVLVLGALLSRPYLVAPSIAQVSPPATQAPADPALVPGAAPGRAPRSVSDAEIWREVRKGLQGNVSIPDRQAGVLIQSEGDNWRAVRNGPVSVLGAWALLGVIALLALFFAFRGRIRVEHGLSGQVIERFNSLERFSHWLTAVSFIVLGLSGLNMLYGRYVLRPVLGADLFADLTRIGKFLHNYLAFAFMLGLLLILVLWLKDNVPNRYDLVWLAKGGGLFGKGVHPPSRKFNAGQKLIFWIVILGGASISLTGIALMFPFTLEYFGATFAVLNLFGAGLPTDLTPMQEMQLSQLWHAVLGLILIAVIIAHIYIGSLGMEGAFDAMGTGLVDLNWAREHHDLWVEEVEGRRIGGDD